MRNDRSGHGELHGAGVDEADNVAGSGGLEDAEEWPVAAVLGVQLDDLLPVSEVGKMQHEITRTIPKKVG